MKHLILAALLLPTAALAAGQSRRPGATPTAADRMLNRQLESEPAPGGNADCLYANENLSYAMPEGWKRAPELWGADGRAAFPKSQDVISQARGNPQRATTRGGGILFAHNAKPGQKTDVSLVYDEHGRLLQLKLEQSGAAQRRYSATLDYKWTDGSCQLRRVVVEHPELGGAKAVSFDEKLCADLHHQGLLDSRLSAACGDYNAKLGAAIDAFASSLPADETFTLFTTAPSGNLKLKPYKAHDYPMANAAIANDCLFSWRADGAATPAGAEHAEPTGAPVNTQAR